MSVEQDIPEPITPEVRPLETVLPQPDNSQAKEAPMVPVKESTMAPETARRILEIVLNSH